MKIYFQVTKPYMSQALRRIEEGVKATAPKQHEVIANPLGADLTILPVVSINDVRDKLIAKDTIIWQLCHLTAGGSQSEWQDVWSKAGLVVSYLKLPFLPYLRMPLGYDPGTFFVQPQGPPKYRAVITGYVDMDKGGEVLEMVYHKFHPIIHVGANLKLGSGYHHAENVSDNQMRAIYNSSEYVVAMRMVEGFELPLIEGAACGCIPVALDMECYRRWFRDLALFVDPSAIERGLYEIADGNRRIAHDPLLMEQFTWPIVMHDFWKAVDKL